MEEFSRAVVHLWLRAHVESLHGIGLTSARLRLLPSHFTARNKAVAMTMTKAHDAIHTDVPKGNVKTFVTYDNFGCLKTNFDLVGVVIAMYSMIGILSIVKKSGVPEKISSCQVKGRSNEVGGVKRLRFHQERSGLSLSFYDYLRVGISIVPEE